MGSDAAPHRARCRRLRRGGRARPPTRVREPQRHARLAADRHRRSPHSCCGADACGPGSRSVRVVANLLNGAGIEASLGITVGNTLAPVAGTWLLRRFGFDATLDASAGRVAARLRRRARGDDGQRHVGTAALWLTDQIGENRDPLRVARLVGRRRVSGSSSSRRSSCSSANRSGSALVRERPLEAIAVLALHRRRAPSPSSASPILIPYLAFVPVVWAATAVRTDGRRVAQPSSSRSSPSSRRRPDAVRSRSPTRTSASCRCRRSTRRSPSRRSSSPRSARSAARRSRALRSSEELYRKLFEQANDLVCIIDARRTHHVRERRCRTHHRLHAGAPPGDDDRRARRSRVPARSSAA